MMNNVIVLGCGRSGSSMVAGAITAEQKYNLGGKTHPPDEFNQKGYFETNTINKINDDLLWLCPCVKTTKGLAQGWLSVLWPEQIITGVSRGIEQRIESVVAQQPLCFKDPRFSYTLPIWLRYLNNLKIVCVFRHPSEFLSSLIHLCQNAKYLKKLIIDKEFFENVWVSMNKYILTNYMHLNLLFVNYNQVLYGDGLNIISEFIGNKVDKDFPSKGLKNAKRGLEVKESTIHLYDQLCCLANCSQELK